MPRTRDEAQFERQRARILDEAARLFERAGYEQARMDDLARELGLTKAAIYHYVPSKQALLLESCLGAVRQAETELFPLERHGGHAAGLDTYVRRHLTILHARIEAFTLVFRDRHLLHAAESEPLRHQLHDFTDRLERFHVEGVAAGDFRDLDSRVAVLSLLAMLNGTTGWLRSEDRTLEEVITTMTAMARGALVVEASRPGADDQGRDRT